MKTRFTDEQIIQMIKEQEAGERTGDMCRRYGVSQAPSTNTRANMAAWSRRMRRNCVRLRLRMPSSRVGGISKGPSGAFAPNNAGGTDVGQRHALGCELKKVVTPDAKRKAVAHLMEAHQVSQRRACAVLNVDRSTVRYQSRRADDGDLRDAIKRVSKERRRFGFRRIQVMVRREGVEVNHKKLKRIYREEKLQVRRRGGRKRALGTRKPMVVPHGSNQRWSLDFVSDAFTDGRRFRILAVVDDHTRENLALVADTSLSGLRVTRELDRIVADHGMPGTILTDNVLCAE